MSSDFREILCLCLGNDVDFSRFFLENLDVCLPFFFCMFSRISDGFEKIWIFSRFFDEVIFEIYFVGFQEI